MLPSLLNNFAPRVMVWFDIAGVGMGGQHQAGLGGVRGNDQSNARAALQQSLMFAPQSHDSERLKP